LTKKILSRYVLTDELYVLLKQQILSHTMSAGDKINIDKLARDLGVSNIPIREVLTRLISEGFVTVIPFKGMFVAEMNLKDIDEIFEIRSQLERLSIRKAAPRIPKERLQKILEELVKQEDQPIESTEENVVTQMNSDLHGTILFYTDNSNLERLVTSLIERIHRYLNLIHYRIEMQAERYEHETIVRCLLANETNEAVKAMEIHLANAHKRLRSNFFN
jgi:DNA-binding GntR family transcriptional regulator